MRLDSHVLLALVFVVAGLLGVLVPMADGFGKPTAWETTVFALGSVLGAFVLGKRFGEGRR